MIVALTVLLVVAVFERNYNERCHRYERQRLNDQLTNLAISRVPNDFLQLERMSRLEQPKPTAEPNASVPDEYGMVGY